MPTHLHPSPTVRMSVNLKQHHELFCSSNNCCCIYTQHIHSRKRATLYRGKVLDELREADTLSSNIDDLLSFLPACDEVPAGITLIERDETASWVGLLCLGIVRLSFADKNGIDRTIGLRAKGYWVNPQNSLRPLPSQVRITTLTQVKMIRMPASEFVRLVSVHDPILRNLLEAQLTEAVRLQRAMYQPTLP